MAKKYFLMDRDEVEKHVKPLITPLVETAKGAWLPWKRHALLMPEVHAGMSIKTMAVYVHDEFIRLAKPRFAELGIRSFVYNDVFFLQIADGLILRHKKLNRSGLPRCYGTDAALGLSNQPWLIPDAKPIVKNTIIVLAWETDEARMDVKSVKIVMMKGRIKDWAYRIDIDDNDEQQGNAVILKPNPQLPFDDQPTVRLKETKKKKTAT